MPRILLPEEIARMQLLGQSQIPGELPGEQIRPMNWLEKLEFNYPVVGTLRDIVQPPPFITGQIIPKEQEQREEAFGTIRPMTWMEKWGTQAQQAYSAKSPWARLEMIPDVPPAGVLTPSMVKAARARGTMTPAAESVMQNIDELTRLDELVSSGIRAQEMGHKVPSRTEISGYLKRNKGLLKDVRNVEQQSGVPLLDESGKLYPASPIELRMKEGGRQEFPTFTRSLSQTYMDRMPPVEREAFRRSIISSVEQAYTGVKEPYKGELGQTLAQVGQKKKYFLPSVVKEAEKTIGSVNTNTACPMFNIGSRGCYMDGCYVTAMGRGGASFNLYNSGAYFGELLQLSDDTISKLNNIGGLRLNGAGDASWSQLDQWRDIFRHAEMRGLQLKVISKQDDAARIIDQLQREGIRSARDVVLQPSLDPYWVPITTDDLVGSGAREMGLAKSAKRAKGTAAEEPISKTISDIYGQWGRDVKVINGKLYRKYGYSWDRLNELAQKYPNVKIQPRVVVSTPKEIAEYALNMPEVLQTWMHGKTAPMWSDIEAKIVKPMSEGGQAGNFPRQISIQKIRGEWRIQPQAAKGTKEVGEGTSYRAVENYIKSNYTAAEQEKIFTTLAGQLDKNPSALCCKIGASKDACMDCVSHCATGRYQIGEGLEEVTKRGARLSGGQSIGLPEEIAARQIGRFPIERSQGSIPLQIGGKITSKGGETMKTKLYKDPLGNPIDSANITGFRKKGKGYSQQKGEYDIDETVWYVSSMSDDIGGSFTSYEDAKNFLKNRGFSVPSEPPSIPTPYGMGSESVSITAEHPVGRSALQEMKQKVSEKMASGKDVFIRVGDVPIKGKSYNYREKVLEEGVSVFRGKLMPNGEVMILPQSNQELATYFFNYPGRKVYIAEGEVIGIGSDGEPVLANVTLNDPKKAAKRIFSKHSKE